MIWALALFAPAAGALALLLRRPVLIRVWLVAAGLGQLLLAAAAMAAAPAPVWNGWLALDAAGKVLLGVISLLFFIASLYTYGYLRPERQADAKHESFALPAFASCLLFFLGAMTWVVLSQHLVLLWAAVEATTLSSAPLIYFHRSDRSLEATWKYLLLCSVGIALALLGTYFLAMAAGGSGSGLTVQELAASARSLHAPWLKGAWILLLVGYGTKMGLAPMHAWLPDAHSEAPSPVSALLSGALLSCAFLGIARAREVCAAAGQGAFAQYTLVALGLFSMLVAAVFILGQTDFKRMLAYSSIEHMGVLALGLGIGGAGIYASLLHAVNHSLAKAMMFLLAGNVLAAYGTKAIADVRGAGRLLPVSGPMWMAGFLALAGFPPFGLFWSEWLVLKAALNHGAWLAASLYLLFLLAVVIGMASSVVRMVQGALPAGWKEPLRERLWAVLPPALLGAGILLLGVYLPSFVRIALEQAAVLLGGAR
ncbi:MAG: proton-conducting transporter membrane subunit [candidate division FCPU426 bacterium]